MMADLATRCEQAAETEQREFLEQAFYALNPAPPCNTEERSHWVRLSHRFHDMLDAKAFLSAAALLVPEGWRTKIILLEDGRGGAWLILPGEIDPPNSMTRLSSAPALALAAACLRVSAEVGGGQA